MAGQRAAGYCSNCNRGVSIERPQAAGLMDKMRSALNKTGDDSDWVCSKCGHPASRGFNPSPEEIPSHAEEDNGLKEETPVESKETEEKKPAPFTAEVKAAAAPEVTTPACPECSEPLKPGTARCEFCDKTTTTPGKLEATCHLCNKPIPFEKEMAQQQISCTACGASVVLPGVETDSSLLTSPPKIMKLDDDPERPDISKAICTECNFELTYPKRLAGKNVDCPSCSEQFILP